MKIAVVGDGVVGRVLAIAAADSADVTVFSCPGIYRGAERVVAGEPSGVVGLQWSFPEFASAKGSMPVWGGMLAVPSQETLDAYNISLRHERLLALLVRCFDLEVLYGMNLGVLSYLFKAKPTVHLPPSIRQVSKVITGFEETGDGVVLVAEDGQCSERFDHCFVATGSVRLPRRVGGQLRMERPSVVFDKVISIVSRTGPFAPHHSCDGEIAVLSVPICVPISAGRADVAAVFGHIMARSGLVPWVDVVAGYARHSGRFVAAALSKVMQRNTALWFSTWSGVQEYPLMRVAERVSVNRDLLTRFGGEIFMPALHCDARLEAGTDLGARIHTEHLGADCAPVSFNPVVLRLAKLYAELGGVLNRKSGIS